MNKSSLQSAAAQALFDACLNVTEKGQSQWFTPLPFGQACARLLPAHRPIVCDLTAGAGHLLHATANASTRHLLGADVDADALRQASDLRHQTSDLRPPTSALRPPRSSLVCAEFTALTRELDDVEWNAPLFALNPPYGLSFKPDRLDFLAESELPAVAHVFSDLRSQTSDVRPQTSALLDSHGGVDSSLAVLAAALHFCGREGEGFAICNHRTLDRLLFAQGAPAALLARHAWLRVILPGNPMTGLLRGNFDTEYFTEVVFFARGHTVGPHRLDTTQADWEALTPEAAATLRAEHRLGEELCDWQKTDQPPVLWSAVADELALRAGAATRHPWNAWLADGVVRTHLSAFQSASRRVDKTIAAQLTSLNGKRPMELVLQRNRRNDLLAVIEADGWRIQPELAAAVQRAVTEYHASRAPLYPLPEIQRLGYLDELDTIECKRDLVLSSPPNNPQSAIRNPQPIVFRAGQSYPLRTQTTEIKRTAKKPNSFTGELETIEFTGQELAVLIADGPGDEAPEYCFMDGRLLTAENTTLRQVKRAGGRAPRYAADPKPQEVIDFTTEDLVRHFIIPEVPDVATLNPERYQHYVSEIHAIEHALAEG